MQLTADEFLRRFLMHILSQRFHRIRHFGLMANHRRKHNLQLIRSLLAVLDPLVTTPHDPKPPTFVCRYCSSPMIVIQIMGRPQRCRAPP